MLYLIRWEKILNIKIPKNKFNASQNVELKKEKLFLNEF